MRKALLPPTGGASSGGGDGKVKRHRNPLFAARGGAAPRAAAGRARAPPAAPSLATENPLRAAAAAAALAAVPAAPEGWTLRWSERRGRLYFTNDASGVKRWRRPAAELPQLKCAIATAGALEPEHLANAQDGAVATPAPTDGAAPEAPPDGAAGPAAALPEEPPPPAVALPTPEADREMPPPEADRLAEKPPPEHKQVQPRAGVLLAGEGELPAEEPPTKAPPEEAPPEEAPPEEAPPEEAPPEEAPPTEAPAEAVIEGSPRPPSAPVPSPPPAARLNVKEWLVLKNAATKGIPGFAAGKTGLPEGWVKRFSPSGKPEFFHSPSGTMLGAVGDVVEWQCAHTEELGRS